MAERRRWDRSAAAAPVAMPAASAAKDEAKEEAADPVLQRQRQYIKILEERNRLKKRLAETQRKKDRLQEREEAFTTAFNVPGSAAGATRKPRTAGSTLPAGGGEQCKSAPALALHGGDRPRVKAGRAKWAKPQGPMMLAAETDQEGRTQYMLAERLVVAESKDEEEESYLEESFEEFDSDGGALSDEDERQGSSGGAKEIVIDESIEDESTAVPVGKSEVKHEQQPNAAPVRASGSTTAQAQQSSAPKDLSKTTRDLMSMIEGLSRSKQHVLMDVLHKFQTSQQRDSDVAELRSSVGDPEIWRQLTSTLFAQDDRLSQQPRRSEPVGDASTIVPSKSAVDQVIEEHRRWEERYAQEMKERLTKEREAKEAALKEAEARRLAMMKQLEDEEKEIERLMVAKRQQRLAKLRALEAQLDEEDAISPVSSSRESAKSTAMSASTTDSEPKQRAESKMVSAKPTDGFSGSGTRSVQKVDDRNEMGGDAKEEIHSPVVPPLKLKLSLSSPIIKPSAAAVEGGYEVRVKLVSTWARARVVGLTQITPYDSMGAEMEVDVSSLRLYDHVDGKPLPKSNDMVRGLQRLFNGIAHTNSDHNMWLGRLPDSGNAIVLKNAVNRGTINYRWTLCRCATDRIRVGVHSCETVYMELQQRTMEML